MKNVVIKILAVLLTVWYSMSIIGFDVHTCNGSGRSFVATFAKGLACEDIHPEHSCEKASCCSDHHGSRCSGHVEDHSDCPFCDGMSIRAHSCCSSDYQVLALTGTVSQNDHEHLDECGCGFCPCVGFHEHEMPALYNKINLLEYVMSPDSGVRSACERQAALRVWRI